MDKVIIFDTTLRDGEQAAGGMLNFQEKLEIARQLDKLGVDVIEAGFPVSSEGDFEAVKSIANEIGGAIVCGLARAHPKDIDRAWEAIKGARRPRIHVFVSAWTFRWCTSSRRTASRCWSWPVIWLPAPRAIRKI